MREKEEKQRIAEEREEQRTQWRENLGFSINLISILLHNYLLIESIIGKKRATYDTVRHQLAL